MLSPVMIYFGQMLHDNICESMCLSQDLSEFQRGTVIGCHLCNKSSREISSLLNIPQSTVSGIITKWKRLGTTAIQPWSGRPCKMTEWSQWMLRHIVHRGRQLYAESVATDLQTSCGLQITLTLTLQRASWNMFPWPSSCIQVSISKVQCKASDAVV